MNLKNVAENGFQCLEESTGSSDKNIEYLEERVRYLEEVNRYTLDALEVAASLGDFQNSINKLEDIPAILEEARSRIKRLIQFKTMAFFMVDENTNDFSLADVNPSKYAPSIQKEVDLLIENGSFSWALREKRPIIVTSKNRETQLILHAMSTSSRIRGMFVGIVEKGITDINGISLSLLSIIILNSSNALESFELYKMIREMNNNLKKKDNYKILFEAAPDGVEVLDRQGNIIHCNKTHQNLLGYNNKKIIGNHTTDFFSDQSKASFHENFSTLKEIEYVESEIELICSDGSLLPAWRKEKAIYNENRDFIGAVVYNRDISMLKIAEQEKTKLESQLRSAQRMESIGTLAGGIAHNFNNLLMSIMGNASLLRMDIDSAHPYYKNLRNIEQQVQHGSRLTAQLIGFAREGKYEVKPISLNQVVQDTASTFELTRKEIVVHQELDDKLYGIKVDLGQIEQTLLNLYINAADAMPGGGNLFLKTKNVTHKDMVGKPYDPIPGDYILLTIRDDGAGMDKETKERIFEPFFTTKGLAEGTGLGLASAYGIIKAHGGYIDVDSEKSHGTTFSIYLPSLGEAIKNKKELPCKIMKGKETLLLVDDEEAVINTGKQMLKKLGYKVLSATNGIEALELYEKNQDNIDMILLDMVMPIMGGGETYDKMRKINSDIKVLLASGYSIEGKAKEILERGCDGFIQKPFSIEELSHRIRNILDKD
jgi:two-component system cell cycle sensor histidine kinase/response regulator CckA